MSVPTAPIGALIAGAASPNVIADGVYANPPSTCGSLDGTCVAEGVALTVAGGPTPCAFFARTCTAYEFPFVHPSTMCLVMAPIAVQADHPFDFGAVSRQRTSYSVMGSSAPATSAGATHVSVSVPSLPSAVRLPGALSGAAHFSTGVVAGAVCQRGVTRQLEAALSPRPARGGANQEGIVSRRLRTRG